MIRVFCIAALTLAISALVNAQDVKSRDAVDVTAAEIKQLIEIGVNNPIKSLDDGKSTVFVWFETRKPGASEAAVLHRQLTEVYTIVQGSALLRTGGTLTGTRPLTVAGNLPGTDFPRFPNPSLSGRIVGGVSRRVVAGDVIVVPPNTAHLWEQVDSPMLAYYIIRIDSDRLLHAGYSNPVLAK